MKPINREAIANGMLMNHKNSWGLVLNDIQDIAENKLSEKDFYNFLVASGKDNEVSDGQDFVYFNNKTFDWKEFKTKAKEIVLAFLEYFTDEQLSKMFYNGR